MVRRIIKIDEEKCNGCGLCVNACHEGAIKLIDGVARLVKEDFCDGLGDCLTSCPLGAITFEEREALAYDESAVAKAKNKAEKPLCACSGTKAKTIQHSQKEDINPKTTSRLAQWPCQIKLVPTGAPYFDGANLLIAADCTAYAYGNFHNDFIRNHITLIGCPKLDAEDYTAKLTEIISKNNVKSVKIVRMEVPCCSGIENAAKRAIMESGKFIPWQVVTITTDGKITD